MDSATYLIKCALADTLKPALISSAPVDIEKERGDSATTLLSYGLGSMAIGSGASALSCYPTASISQSSANKLREVMGIPKTRFHGDYFKDELLDGLLNHPAFGKPNERFYNPGSNRVWMGNSRSAATLAHEFGHAVDQQRGIFMPRWKNALRGTAGKFVPALGALGALGGLSSDPKESVGKTALKGALIGGGAGTLSSLPLLISEGKASYYGLKGLSQIGKTRGAKLHLLGALGTYLTNSVVSPAALGASSAVSTRLIRKTHENQQRMNQDRMNA